ncbi:MULTISPECIES: hypothetical protein [Pseudonocardia]|uniref:Uncharacterized protein n=1 Tax=Pseudonocardia saturnea TaxID=33909 RepID=A0ABQ0RV41_9PSEU|nr:MULTISPECIES: hypothetical protein [Pseudonocardia]BBG02204.1 hypothetical protein Pdca_34130 [Pseudonocardia autotrophica]GEC24219.1 hypothetical protein PSA01_12480 [Pseudonocardia saturnea]
MGSPWRGLIDPEAVELLGMGPGGGAILSAVLAGVVVLSLALDAATAVTYARRRTLVS